MGQLACSKPEDQLDFQRFSLAVSKGEFSPNDKEGSLMEKYLLGKNMKIGKNTILETVWKEKLDRFQKLLDINENDSSSYQNSLSKRESIVDPNLSHTDKLMLLFSQLEKVEFKKYGLHGIPQEYRWSYWKTITSQGEKEKYGTADIDASYCINKDINRTLIDEAFKDEEIVKKLDGVLNVIAYRFPKVGYCQGMNYIAALLLMVSGANQNETIQVFSHMLKSSFYMLNLMFQNDLPLLFVLEQIILSVIEIRLPKLSKHLINNEIPTSFWLSKMLLSGFVYLYSVRDCVLLWDYILIKGTVKGFAELIFAMMQLYQEELIKKDQSEIAEFFSFQETKKDGQEVIKKALTNKEIEGKEIRKIMSKNNTPIGILFQKFDEPDFDDNYKKFSKQ